MEADRVQTMEADSVQTMEADRVQTMEADRAQIKEFESCFRLGDEIVDPSSWWYWGVLQLTDTDIPPDVRMYCEWNPYYERRTGGWYWHPPHHILCLEDETDFLVAQKGRREWITYDPKTQQWIHTKNGGIQNTWTSLHDVLITLCPGIL